MASLMDNLVEVLEEENTQYEKLVELSKSKKRAIIKTDVVELEKITGQEQEVCGLLRNLDNRRDAVLKDMADELWLEKRNLVKQKGEKANSKLLVPTVVIFIGILFMVMAPVISGL